MRFARSFARWLAAIVFAPLIATAQPAADSAPPADGHVGNAKCALCHQLETEHWAHTVHARILGSAGRNAIEKRGCESCHGPGAKHMQSPMDKALMVNFTRKGATPIEVQNGQCMQCHQGKQRMFWKGSRHERGDLACSDCHNPMARFSADGLLRKASVTETCYACHQEQRAEFMKRSHMPLPEGKLTCTDCHNPHGSPARAMIKADSVNHLCYTCHQEKRGPFLWEHPPVRENCLNCHLAHGSNNEKLLMVARPFLCQQCHAQILHPNDLVTRGNFASGGVPDPRGMNRSCGNCHAQVHGSNHPSGARFHR